MKNKNLLKLPILFFSLLIALAFQNCRDDSYLEDGGKSNPNYNGTVLEYLNSRPDYFKELVEVIKLAGMEDVFKKDEITFFAPPDWSIKMSMERLNSYWYSQGNDSVTDISQIKPEVWKDLLSLYIVKDKYLLKDIPQIDTVAMNAFPGQAYISYNGRPMNIGVVYADANGIKYAGYRQLLYSYVNDFTESDMTNAYVATSDIQPTNGVVHVIRFTNHIFGFNITDFISKAVTAGIDERPKRKSINSKLE
jgi:hypothetical protein